MKKDLELQQIIFHLLETQIKFGIYRYGESLPTIKEASDYFLASVDTVRLAYVRLKQEGYISLSTCVGARVKVQYSDEEIGNHIQAYFSCRKSAILDLARSERILFGYAQWVVFKSASPETLDELERSSWTTDIPTPYRMSLHFLLLYSTLGNDFCVRLIWQVLLFFQAPFLSVPHYINYFEQNGTSPNDMMMYLVHLCREKDWEGLWRAIENYEDMRFVALCRFYEQEIQPNPDTPQVAFAWCPYKKASQRCYTICMELLMQIRRGEYPVGSFLPSLERLAQEKQVSLNTIRRTVQLLNKLGTVESINGVGTKVLPFFDSAVKCDFTDNVVQKRLLDFAQCFQFLALSCRACSKITLESMDADTIQVWIRKLEFLKSTEVYEDVIYICHEMIATHGPYQGIRTVYQELIQQLFWGIPLCNLHGDRESTKAYFAPYLDSLIDFLIRTDPEGFSKRIEEMQMNETRLIAAYLVDLGIQEAASLL